MSELIERRLLELGVELPPPAPTVANYLASVRIGQLIFLAGQLPFKDGRLMAMGILGRELGTEAGKLAAKWCAVNVLAEIRNTLGGFADLRRIVKITVFVASTPDYTEQHLVANGASDFLVAALGERGEHARSTIGVASLPLNAPVEIEAIIEADRI